MNITRQSRSSPTTHRLLNSPMPCNDLPLMTRPKSAARPINPRSLSQKVSAQTNLGEIHGGTT